MNAFPRPQLFRNPRRGFSEVISAEIRGQKFSTAGEAETPLCRAPIEREILKCIMRFKCLQLGIYPITSAPIQYLTLFRHDFMRTIGFDVEFAVKYGGIKFRPAI